MGFRHLLSAGLATLCALPLLPAPSAAQTQVKPWFFVIVDTSGSMALEDVGSNSCGYVDYSSGQPNRMAAARCAIRNIFDSTGDAEFGLLQFQHSCRNNCDDNYAAGACTADIDNLEVVNPDTAVVREWVDGVCEQSSCGSVGGQRELYAVGSTPLGATLVAARDYFSDSIATKPSPTQTDLYAGCRPVSVILLTDGNENCGGSASTAATNLRSTTVPLMGGSTATIDIKTYVIGFGSPGGDFDANALQTIATNGGTSSPYFVANEAQLSAALNQIIVDSQVNESCDGVDNDCDGLIDEDHPKYCDINQLRTMNPMVVDPSSGLSVDQGTLDSRLATCNMSPCPAVSGTQGNALCAQPEWSSSSDPACSPANILCESPGEICNVEDDDCDGAIDENAPPLASSAEQCNDGVDNDCDSRIDENCVGCSPESCDGLDNDCDTAVDEITRPCGRNVGQCTTGVEQCIGANTWGTCSGVQPQAESCNGLDDDCDGVIDGNSRACGSDVGECQQGTETCTNNVWGSCVGEITPGNELCDGKDNDCDNDPNDDGADDARIGQTCGSNTGDCNTGTWICSGGGLFCQGEGKGGSELCDGKDNDCDGNIDEGVSTTDPAIGLACIRDGSGNVVTGAGASVQGECQLGATACSQGAVVCSNYVGPTPELCDNKDHDCDGNNTNGVATTDPQIGDTCGSIIGVCAPGGTVQCISETPTCNAAVVPGQLTETCDGRDEDCDGKIDEGVVSTTQCDSTGHMGRGLCELGTEACVRGAWVCQNEVKPNAEVCDGEDNDCDGKTDENASQVGLACGSDTGECMKGKYVCVAGKLDCPDDIEPTMEVCDGKDNDCDGAVDDSPTDVGGPCDCTYDNSCGLEAAPGSCRRSTDPSDPSAPLDQLCGECKWGRLVCADGAISCSGYVGPMDELCNGRDDDCDDPCLRLDTDADGVLDQFNCPDTCDASDPDCLSQIDEGVEATDPNLGILCGDNDTGECEKGMQTCVNGSYMCQGEVKPSVEICDGKDNDCDTLVDDGIPVGDPCGQTDVGECSLGFTVCDVEAGEPVCQGEVGPSPEICDQLDNDCNGLIDDGIALGAECGSSVGECSPGRLTCTEGRSVCVGEDPPQPEVCDCKDNDCDGEVDEVDSGDSEGLCGAGAACVMCQCALPCLAPREFGTRCPTGKAPVETDGECHCVGQLCDPDECGQETLTNKDTGAVQCAPESAKVGACVCSNNECTFRCAGKQCEEGLICDTFDGKCKVQSCRLPQFACPEGERCDADVNDCVADECASADCPEGCRLGECFGSCNLAEPCGDGDKCVAGACVEDKCAGVVCGPGNVCDPDSGECVTAGACVATGCADDRVCDPIGGECVTDPCDATRCPVGETCEAGECVALCESDRVPCDGVCINPLVSREHCGATDVCLGGDAGEKCAADEVCSLGKCADDCAEGLVKCDNNCIDPMTDGKFCGAVDDCAGDNAGSVCFVGSECTDGVCVSTATGDGDGALSGDGDSGDGDGSDKKSARFVLGTGGSACACRVPGGAGGEAPTRGGALFGALLLLATLVRVRRRTGRGRTRLVPAIVSALLLLLGGCKIDPYCIDCADSDDIQGNGRDGGSDPFGNGDGDGNGPSGRRDGGKGPGTKVDAGKGNNPTGDGGTNTSGDGGKPQCGKEICNGLDDDCDGQTDEDVDPEAEGIDVNTNVNHCGGCGNVCGLAGAFPKCVDGECRVDSCDVGQVDLDKQPDNGCEYRCTKRADTDDDCNFRDDDCDGETDEDIDFKTDPDNCNSCGFTCGFPHAVNGGACVDSKCVLDGSQCDDDYHDVNGVDGDGCEYRCTPAAGGKELCNRKDDDCDGKFDEDVDTDDPSIGAACGSDTGACTKGTNVCQDGRVVCEGEVKSTTEVCDGDDNDCDGQTDEADNQIGQDCGNSVGQCSAGAWACNAGQLECVGGVSPAPTELCNGLDDDCDGSFDENPLNEGMPCSTFTGNLVLSPSALPGTCAAGTAHCANGGLVCLNETGPAAELCDGLDNDCDGSLTDDGEDEPLLGSACGSNQGECSPGQWQCDSGKPGLVCQGGNTGGPELCNGDDDDCDGKTDEGVATTDTAIGVDCILDSGNNVVTGAGATVQGECQLGKTECSGGGIVCIGYVGPGKELCDNKDHDCDGSPLANLNDARIGSACPGNGTGECDPGIYACNMASMSLTCTGVVGPTAELCDGKDNDCDGANDDGADEPTLNDPCGIATGACQQGARSCVGGAMQCVGQVRPVPEKCDANTPADFSNENYDDDCDGNVDEDFQFDTDVNRCGTCNNACSFPNAIAQCVSGSCSIAACQPNYHLADCSYNCSFNGAEVCNGADDDCDQKTDEGLTPPTCECGGASATCTAGGWVCSQEPTSEICNGVDDDCDGSTDEGFGLGAACTSTGIGACATPGTIQCDPTDTNKLLTRCADSGGNAVMEGSATQETCNAKDDDCDGSSDEACPSAVGSCVTDAWVTIAGGTEVYKYEASRPDGSLTGSGSNESRACSAAGRLPWTNVTYAEAMAACVAAGARLCTEAEWEQSCMDDQGGTCQWGYPSYPGCNSYSTSQCNGVDYTDATYPKVQPTGQSGSAGQCYRSYTSGSPGGDEIYELSGNIKEYVLQRSDGAIPVRGGAYNNLAYGLSCGFDFPVWPNNSPFPNVGFRCCRSSSLPDTCTTVSRSSLSLTNSSLVTDTMTVSLQGGITSVQVSTQGTHSRFNEVTRMELVHPDGTVLALFTSNASNCDNTDDDWDFVFVDGGSTWPPSSSACNGSAVSGTYAPASSLATAFAGKSALGDWTLRVLEQGATTGSRSITLDSWALDLCVDPTIVTP